MEHQSCSPFLLVCRSFGRTLWAAEPPQSLKQASYIANLLLGLARTLIFMCQTHVMHIGLPMSSKIFRAIVFSACCRCSKITKPYPQDRLVIVFLHTLTEQIGLNGWNSLCNNCSVTSGCKSLTSNDPLVHRHPPLKTNCYFICYLDCTKHNCCVELTSHNCI